MSFLTPISALLAAAIAIPLLLLLYVLRLRRQRLRIASTLLWEKSFEDLQANAPFQRLRWSLLLILQLLLLALLLLAVAQPMIRGEGVAATRTVLLIDRSASMNALLPQSDDDRSQGDDDDQPRTRLDAAKHLARDMVNSLSRSDQPRQMMVIAFGSSPQVITTYESSRRALLDAIDSIEPTHEQANLEAALQLASAFAAGRDEREQEPPDVVLLSDGGVDVRDSSTAFRLRAGQFRFVQVVPASGDAQAAASQRTAVNNIGITSFSVRRDEDDPARVLVFARLVNAGTEPVEIILTLSLDDQIVATIRRSLPAADAGTLGEDSFTHALELSGGAVLHLRHNLRDDLRADDAAWLVLPEPARPRVALVHPTGSDGPDPFAHDLLDALEPQQIDVMTADRFAAIDPHQLDSGGLYELVVFDRVPASRLPGVPSMTFGATPALFARRDEEPRVQAPAAQAGQFILSWDRQHPLMRNVSLDTIVFTGFDRLPLPAGATPLAFGPDGPIIAVVSTRGARHVVVGFELIKSNWPLHVSSAIFMQNALEYLTLARLGQNGLVHRPGDTISIRAAADVSSLRIQGPATFEVAVQGGGMITLPALREVGLYTVTGAMPPFDQLAISLLSDVESDIRPTSTVRVNADQSQATRASAAAAQPLWPWLVGAAVLILVLEWLVYCKRARGL